jgi:hypothetical protein
MAAHYGFPFGNQLVFTYGPLGFLDVNELWYGSTGGLAFAYAFLLRLALALALFAAARRNYGLVIGWVVALAVASVGDVAAEVVIALIFALWLLQRPPGAPATAALCCLAGAYAGVEVLIKESPGVTIIVLTAILLIGLPRPRKRTAAAALASFLVAFLIAWLASGQSLGALPAFVHNVGRVIAGYSYAMQIAIPGLGWQYAAAWILFGFGVVAAIATTTGEPARTRATVLALWTAFSFLLFKEGFVRHDAGHADIFFVGLLGGSLAFRWGRGWRVGGLGFSAAALALALAVQGNSFGTDFDPSHRATLAVDQFRQVLIASERYATIRQGRVRIEAADPLDTASLQALRGRTVAVWPTELSMAWAYQLSWKPLPVLQGYTAYTAGLDELDLRALVSPHAPQRILYRADPGVDGRVPSFDAPGTSRAMLCRYREEHWTPTTDVLALASDRCSAPQSLGVVHAGWGESVPVPAPPNDHSLVFVRIGGVGVGGLEEIKALLDKPTLRYVVLDGASHRLIVGTASDGLPLRASPGIDFTAPFNVATGTATIAVTKDGQGRSGGTPITFSFFAESFSAGARAAATGGPSPLTPSQEAVVATSLTAARSYCTKPVGPPPLGLRSALARLLVLEQRTPRSVATDPTFSGQTLRQVTADIGGLLNTHCAPGLAAEVARALARTPG